MKIPSALLVMLTVPLGASAQTNANSFRELQSRQLLREGDAIVITYTQDGGDDHAVTRGTFVRLTGAAVELQLDSGTHIEIAECDVRRIERERKDSVWRGALIGAGVGLSLGALSCSDGFGCDSRAVAGALLGLGGIGFAVGAGIDAAIGKTHRELVYLGAQRDTGSMTVSVSPILSRGQKGVLLTLTW
jgi:hypothetical protein